MTNNPFFHEGWYTSFFKFEILILEMGIPHFCLSKYSSTPSPIYMIDKYCMLPKLTPAAAAAATPGNSTLSTEMQDNHSKLS